MARIYQPTEYGSSFQGSAREEQFSPVQPFDQSEAIKKRAQEKIDNIKNLARASEIQANLDRATLAGNQQIAKAQFEGKWKVVQGILSLTKTGIDAYSTIKAEREQKQKDIALFNSIGGGEYVPETINDSSEVNRKQELEINSESAAINETANDLIKEGGIENLDLANQLKESSTSNKITYIKGDVFGAVGAHQAYLRERIANIPPDEMPKGLANINAKLKEFNHDFLKERGLLDKRLRDLVLENLAKPMVNNSAYIAAELNQKDIKDTQKVNRVITDNYIATLVDNPQLTSQEKWTKASDAFFGNNVGFTNRTLANEAALKQLLEEISLEGPLAVSEINNFRNVLQNGKPGTELNKTYKSLFDEYEIKARENNIKEFTRKKNERTIANQKLIDSYYSNPTPENKLKAQNALLAIGTKESIAEATALGKTALTYDPKKVTEYLMEMAEGSEFDEEIFKTDLDLGSISEADYNILIKSGPLKQTKKDLKAFIKSIDISIENVLTKGLSKADLQQGNLLSSLGIKKEQLKQELYERLLGELRVNRELINDKGKLGDLSIDILEQLTKPGESKYEVVISPDSAQGYAFAYDIKTNEQNLKDINIVGQPGSQDFSSFSYNQLFNEKKFSIAEMSATNDYFFNLEQVKDEFEYFETNGIPSQKLLNYSKALGYTPKAFLNEQVRLFEKHPNYNKNEVEAFKANIPKVIGNTTGGYKYLIKEGGLSNKGSAYLAATVENFSGWNFNEDDKGLKTCAPFMDHPMRVSALEKEFGKSVKQITAKEQLRYMIQEMKKDYPEVYTTLTNPFASDGDIKKALVNYVGFINPNKLDKTVKSLIAP